MTAIKFEITVSDFNQWDQIIPLVHATAAFETTEHGGKNKKKNLGMTIHLDEKK